MKQDYQQKFLEMRKKRKQSIQNTIASVKIYLQKPDIGKAVKTVKEFGDYWFDEKEFMLEIDRLFNEQKIISYNCINCNSHVESNSDKFNWRHTQMLCKKCETEIEQREREKRCKEIMKMRGIPKRYLNASIENFPPHFQKLAESNSGIYLYGPCGVGKTHLLAALFRHDAMEYNLKNECMGKIDNKTFFKSKSENHYFEQPIFRTTPELLQEIRATYNRNDEYNEEYFLDLYSKSNILYLDDFGAEKPTEWVLQTLFLIIDRRYRNILKTVISSNFSLSEISDRLYDRIASRIAGMCEVREMSGEDRRLKK